jgi:hypothetical protein
LITDEQKQLIREMSGKGETAKNIAEKLNISVKTVRKYKNAPAPDPQNADDTGDLPITSNSIISSSRLSSEKQDKLKGRHFGFVVYPSEEWLKENVPDCPYNGAEGYGQAPNDWIEQLINTGLPFVVSPLHDKDVNPDETPKKPHWHVIISWNNTTTYRSARVIAQTILCCPLPQLLKAVEGAYRYLTHQDNPEKYQYSEIPKCYNGWKRPLDNNAITAIKAEIRKLVYLENCVEYGELVAVCTQISDEYFDVVSNNTYFFDKLCSSFRHNPLRTLYRVSNEFEGEERETIEKLIDNIVGGTQNESNN